MTVIITITIVAVRFLFLPFRNGFPVIVWICSIIILSLGQIRLMTRTAY